MSTESVFLGIDVGTSGARTVAATALGEVLATAARPLTSTRGGSALHEQDPREWRAAVLATLGEIAGSLERSSRLSAVAGVSVTSTSGTLVVAGRDGGPLRPAIMYDDGRSRAEAGELNSLEPPGAWNASHSLAKALWVRAHEPAVWERAAYLLHPADWLAGCLCGGFGLCDYSNALKLGYDVAASDWAPVVRLAGIPSALLPRVVAPGERTGTVSAATAGETGLPAGVAVIAGATDGVASLIASGASRAGESNTTLGSTLVWKTLCPGRPRAVHGIYSHRHPGGLWAPGAASNTGPGALRNEVNGADGASADLLALQCMPLDLACYILPGTGERFPFSDPRATSFFERVPADAVESYAAQLQALAFAERWGYELLQEAGAAPGSMVFSAGSAARSPALSQLRADVSNRTVVRCAETGAAFGAAILAASRLHFAGDVCAAIRGMTRRAGECAPEPAVVRQYDGLYRRFRECCRKRGYCE